MTYTRNTALRYYSKRYGKYIDVERGFPSDGATGAIDIKSGGWWVHDKICTTWKFSDGTTRTNFQASSILSDILRKEGRWCRAIYWWPATYAFVGCKLLAVNLWHRLTDI